MTTWAKCIGMGQPGNRLLGTIGRVDGTLSAAIDVCESQAECNGI